MDDGRISIGLLRARDEHWRTARRTLTPTFSAHKMKMVRLCCFPWEDVHSAHIDNF